MKKEDLFSHFPYLWHMASDGSWPSIRNQGLLSARAILEAYGVAKGEWPPILSQRRSNSIVISSDGLPDAVIRDQKPMSDGALVKCLQGGVTPAQWYRHLNERTFFWLSSKRLRRLLNARAYRDKPQMLLTLDTQSLVNAHESRIELCPINSGSTIYRPIPRGLDTFRSIAKYDFEHWRKKRSRQDAVVELVVKHSVPDVKDHVLAVHRWTGKKIVEVWRRAGTPNDVGP